MSLTSFVKWPKFEEYEEMFEGHFIMEKRDDGLLLVRMHTKGGPQPWSMELHRAIWQMWRTVGSDSEIELVIFTGTGDQWIVDFEPKKRERRQRRAKAMDRGRWDAPLFGTCGPASLVAGGFLSCIAPW
jgi:hypothetical protein